MLQTNNLQGNVLGKSFKIPRCIVINHCTAYDHDLCLKYCFHKKLKT